MECFYCETDVPTGAEHPPWQCLNNMTALLNAERQKSRALRERVARLDIELTVERSKSRSLQTRIAQAADQLLGGMRDLEAPMPEAFIALSSGHSAALETLKGES